jgi:protein-tyrosine phosphatase
MIRILIVCTYNLCRSPLAAGILKKKFEKENIPAFIDSAGFEPHLIGEEIDKNTRDFALQKGIDISSHTVRLFTPDDFDQFDKIYVMDTKGYQDVIFHARDKQDKNKVEYLLDVLVPGKKKSIPHIVDMETIYIEEAYKIFDKACGIIVSSIRQDINTN